MPEMISIVMPKEMIVVIEICREMFDRFLAEKKAGESRLHITVSAGVAGHAGHPDPEFLIERADDALYRAKHAGRNRVHSAA